MKDTQTELAQIKQENSKMGQMLMVQRGDDEQVSEARKQQQLSQ
jgi:hypothetical protein